MERATDTCREIYINGDCEKLLYKDINGYCINISDFSFVSNGTTFNVKIKNPGSNGKWFVFPVDDKLFMSNNVWTSEWVNPKNEGPAVSEIMLKKNLNKKPEDDAITCLDLQHLSKNKQKELINYVLTLIN
jgi:hypothetical protein